MKLFQSAVWTILFAVTFGEFAGAQVPEAVSKKYQSVKSTYGKSIGATLRECEKDGEKYYEVTGNGGYTGETYIYDRNGTEVSGKSFGDVGGAVSEHGADIDLSHAKCDTLLSAQGNLFGDKKH